MKKDMIDIKNLVALFLGLILVMLPVTKIYAIEVNGLDSVVEQILINTPISESELLCEIERMSLTLNSSRYEIARTILDELVADNLITAENPDPSASMPYTAVQLPTKETGGVFYEPVSTLWVQHGHVGIYYSTSIIIESIPFGGVIERSCFNKIVQRGSMTARVNQNSTVRTIAANWAYSCVGDGYSYNFAINRLTGAYGDKNCSKLVWSSYKETANIDLDSNGGLGVYPNDIKLSPYLFDRVDI